MDIFFAIGQQQNMGWPPSNLQVPSQDKLWHSFITGPNMSSNLEALAIVNTATQASCIPSLLGQAIDLAMYRHFVCYSFYRKKN